MTNLQLALAFASTPGKAFLELRERPRFWFPFVLTVLVTLAGVGWYYSFVDFDWLREQMLDAGVQMSKAEHAQAAAMLTRKMLLWSSVIGGLVFLVVARLLEALYYLLAGKITNLQYSFRHWLALACWSGLPLIVAALPAFVLLALANSHQVALTDIQPLSLNALFFRRPMSDHAYSLLSSLTLLHPLAWWLTALGIKIWSGRSWTFSALLVLLPLVVIYGGWAVYVF